MAGRGSVPMLDTPGLETYSFARNRNILRILPGVGPVVIHPQASPDAHLCCDSTLHTMSGSRAAIIIITPSLSSSLLLPAAAAAACFFFSRFVGCVCEAYIYPFVRREEYSALPVTLGVSYR